MKGAGRLQNLGGHSGAFFFLLLAATSAQEPAGFSIHGHVYEDDGGAPSRGAKVTLTDHWNFGRTILSTTTDGQGAFAFTGLTPGSCGLSVEKSDFVSEYVYAEPARDIVIRLRRSVVIGGRVTDTNGKFIKKSVVEVVEKNYTYGEVALLGVSRGFSWTDDLGRYRVADLAPGRYYVRSSGSGYYTSIYPGASGLAGAQTIDMRAGAERNDIDFQLHAARRFNLHGRLLDSLTKGPAEAKFLHAESADLITGKGVDGVVNRGEFRLEGLIPGRYFLHFVWVGPTNNVTRSAVFPFEMGDADASGIILRATSVSVSGHLQPLGQKLPSGLSVYLEPVAPAIRAHIADSVAAVNVGRHGSFRIAGVPAGEYRLQVHSPEPERFFTDERRLSIDGHAAVSGVELALNFAAGTVSGRAIGTAGPLTPRATVVLQSADSDKLASDQSCYIHGVGTAAQYSITGVKPGEYLLFVWRGDPGLIGDPGLFAEARQSAARVVVQAGSVISQDAVELVDDTP